MTPATAPLWLSALFESVASREDLRPSEKPIRKICLASMSAIALRRATAARAAAFEALLKS